MKRKKKPKKGRPETMGYRKIQKKGWKKKVDDSLDSIDWSKAK